MVVEVQTEPTKGGMVKHVLKTRRYKVGYEVRTELIDGAEFGSSDFQVRSAYTVPDNLYIGDPGMAHYLCRVKKIKPELAEQGNNVCSVGFSEDQQRWFGWSHRAICGFGLGDRLFDPDWPEGTDDTPFVEYGGVVIETLAQARQAACNFAEYVS